jgi:addiction module RelE/StbE family toxin
MQLRWTAEAADDLERIADYLLTYTPTRAPDLIRAVYDAPSDLLTFPNRGRQGKQEGTRELVLSPLPYIVVYKVFGETIFVVRILHGAQKWP